MSKSIFNNVTCDVCHTKPSLLCYCYPDGAWENVKAFPKKIKKNSLCLPCAIKKIHETLVPAINDLVFKYLEANECDNGLVEFYNQVEMAELNTMFLLDMSALVDEEDPQTITKISGTVTVGRRFGRKYHNRGEVAININYEDQPDVALSMLCDALLLHVYDVIPTVDYTPVYTGDEDDLWKSLVYEPMLEDPSGEGRIPVLTVPEA